MLMSIIYDPVWSTIVKYKGSKVKLINRFKINDRDRSQGSSSVLVAKV